MKPAIRRSLRLTVSLSTFVLSAMAVAEEQNDACLKICDSVSIFTKDNGEEMQASTRAPTPAWARHGAI